MKVNQPIPKYRIGQKVFFMYNNKLKSDSIVSITIDYRLIQYEIYIYFGVFKDSLDVYEQDVYASEEDAKKLLGRKKQGGIMRKIKDWVFLRSSKDVIKLYEAKIYSSKEELANSLKLY